MLFGFHPEKALVNAERLVQQGKFSAAIDIYEKLISQQSPLPNLKNNLGDLYVQVGRIPEALELFGEVVDYLEREGRQPRAIAVMRKMLKLAPDQLELQIRLARVLSDQGMAGEARGVWLDLLERAERTGNWTLADECIRHLLEIEPESLDLLARAAQSRQGRGDTVGAQKEWLGLGRKAVEREALESLDLALRRLQGIDPEWLPFRMLRARSEVVRGNPAEALNLLPPDEVLKKDASAAAEAWRIALDAEDLPSAQRLAQVAMEAGDAGMAVSMGRELLKQGELDAVVPWMTRQPGWFHRADLRGSWCKLLDDLLVINPDHLPALRAWLELAAEGSAAPPALAPRRQRLAELLRESGDAAAALEQYRLLVRQQPSGEAARQAIAELEAELGLASAEAPATAYLRASDSTAGSDRLPPSESLAQIPPDLLDEVVRATSGSPEAESILNLDDEWAQIADENLEDKIRQIEFFSQNGMLPAARQTLDAELARLPHEPRLQALDIVLRTRMEEALGAVAETVVAPVLPAGPEIRSEPGANPGMGSTFDLAPLAPEAHDSNAASAPPPALEFVLSPVREDGPGLAPATADLAWMAPAQSVPSPPPAPQPRTMAAAASASPSQWADTAMAAPDAGHEDLLQEVLPGTAPGVALPGSPLAGPGEAAWDDWLQNEPAPPRPAAAPELKGRSGEAARLLDDLFDNFRTKVEGQSSNEGGDPEHQYNMGIAYYEMGLFEEGVAELQKSFLGWEGQPQPPRDRLLSCGSTLALCFQQLNMPEMALDWYRRTVTAARLPASESIGLLYEEGRLLEQLGRRDEALECYRQVYATNIDYQDVAECLKRVQTMTPPVA